MNLSVYPWDLKTDPTPENRVLAVEFQPDINAAVVEEFTGGTVKVEHPDPADPAAEVESVDLPDGRRLHLGWIAHRPRSGGDVTVEPRAVFLERYTPHHHH